MPTIANLIDDGVIEEEDENFFVPASDWKIDMRFSAVYHVEITEDGLNAIITREGKYDGHPVIHTVRPNDDLDITLFKRVDPEF